MDKSMDKMDRILEYVRKTNSDMTKEELIAKLEENRLLAIALNTIVK
jgi:hypothetical protein